MIPYIHIPELTLVKEPHELPFGLKFGPLALHPFGLLVATGVIIGTNLAIRRARRLGLDLDRLNSFITWMLVSGFIGGHMLDEIFYHPDEIQKRWYSLFMLWEGLSSFGGFTGGFIGVALWKYFEITPGGGVRRRARPQPILPFCDVILAVFPVAWIFGRSGCSSVHDHPGTLLSQVHENTATALGRVSESLNHLLAVTYPGYGESVPQDQFALFHGHAPRFDLGLLEMLFTCIIAGAFALTWHKKLATGMYIVVVSLAYAPVRFAMDFLRITTAEDPHNADLRYGVGALSFTPAQWECVVLFVFGLAMLFHVRSLKARGIEPMDDVRAPQREGGDEGALTPGVTRAS
jgi:phosphatidylglycerol:prolipoprotein diacylglycerol transferase